jgi:hypothetical protein
MQNDNSEILAELKKINEFNSSSKKYIIVFMLLLCFSIIIDIFSDIQLKNEEKKYYENKNKLLESSQKENQALWLKVQDKLNAVGVAYNAVDNVCP